MRQTLLQNVTALLLQNATENYYKIRQIFYYIMRQLLQIATILLRMRRLLQITAVQRLTTLTVISKL